MLQTIFFIPNEIGGVPLFGPGLLLALCAFAGVVTVGWLAWRQGLNADTLGYIPLFAILGAIVWFVLPQVCEPPDGLPIRGYGTMLLVAVLSAIGLSVWRGQKVGLDPDTIIMLCFWMIVPGIIGARLFFIVQYWDTFQQPTLAATLPKLLDFTKGGLVVYGSVIGGTAGMLVFITRHKLPLLATCDLMAPSFMLGLAIGRLGCFLNGCCFGGPCELPWAVEFPVGSPAHIHQIDQDQAYLHGLQMVGRRGDPPVVTGVESGSAAGKQGLRSGHRIAAVNGTPVNTIEEAEYLLFRAGASGSDVSVQTEGGGTAHWAIGSHVHRPVHPTQIYSSINALVLCLLLLAYGPFRRRDGEVLALFLTIYPITRFLLEIIRNDEGAKFGTGMTISQNLSLVLLALAGIVWVILLKRPKQTVFPKYEAAVESG